MLNRILSSKEKIKMSNKRLCKVLPALILVLSLVLSLAGCSGADISDSINPSHNESTTVQTDKAGGSNPSNKNNSTDKNDTLAAGTDSADWRATLPEYSDSPYVIVNNNEPFFTENDMTADSFEYYGELDELGRCTVAYASIGKDLMPTEKRGSIGSVKPTGWHTVKYDIVDGKYLYNRCHLIGYQLTAENANKNNLITGTRYLNVDGMLLFENMVADYIKETNNHVLYRVTPIFTGDNLLADGVLMEAESVEDNGEGISYNVFCYNVQPGVKIDYVTGDSSLE
jgi:DNA-entry nuclease